MLLQEDKSTYPRDTDYFRFYKLFGIFQFFIFLTIFSAAGALFFLDLLAYPFLPKEAHSKYEKTLPLGKTFLSHLVKHIDLDLPLPPIRDEKKTIQKTYRFFPYLNGYKVIINRYMNL